MSKRSIKGVAPRPEETSLERELSDAVVFFHTALAAHVGMSVADWKCLGLLQRHGNLTAGRLAELSGFTTGAITGIVDRLERSGYARRRPHPTDRRSVIVCLGNIARLQPKIRAVFASLERAMGGVTRHYTPAEKKAVHNWLSQTARILRAETKKLQSPPKKDKKNGTNVDLSVPGGQ